LKSPSKAPRRWQALRAFREAQERLREIGNEPHTADPTEAQFEAARRASGLPVAEVEALVADWMMKRPLKYLQLCRARGLDGLLAAIERAGVPAGVLSDYPAGDKLHALGLASRFFPVLSAADPEIRAFKPNPRGFLRACRIWRLPPSAVLFVGDRVEVDAAGAAAAGMPCAIVSRRPAARHARYATFQSLEQLCRVFDPRP
jgi:FMN phosphatase YigB (HAD superfamily)